ncbi:MAG: DUF1517 domain-containing protein [Sandaracinus sp.]
MGRGWNRIGRALAMGAVLAVLALPGAAARAQDDDTGGSFESSDWGSSGSSDSWGSSGSDDSWGSSSGSDSWGSSGSSDSWGSSGSSDSWGSSSGSDWGSGSGSSYPRTDYDTSPGSGSYAPSHRGSSALGFVVLALILVVVVGGPLAFFVLAGRLFGAIAAPPRRGLVPVRGPAIAPSGGQVDVSMLQLAVDWRARKYVQSKLNELARGGDTASKEGRARLLTATTSALRSVKLAWLYAGARNYAPMPKGKAQQEFQTLANDVRASFRKEIVRAANGRVVTVESQGVSRESDGPGVVLVSVIVASWREIFDADARRAPSIERLLTSLEALRPDDVIALSVVWTPAAEDDRMSTDELEQRHRHLVRIGEIGGRVFCGYCSGPFAEELEKCPHCGAPSPRAEGSAGAK